jgi:hypothetical protein
MPLVSMPRHTLIKPPPALATAAGSRLALMRALLALIVALLLVALVPTSASAYVGPAEPVADPQVDAWLGIAQAWWGGAPDCPEGVQVERAELAADAGVWASAEMPGCRIWLDPDFYPRPAAWSASPWGRREWQKLMCNVVAHEWGHLLGHGHASDPHDLMAPVAPSVVTACRPAVPASVEAAVQSAGKRKEAKLPRARVNTKRKTAARRTAARAAVSTTAQSTRSSSPTTPSNE